MPEGENGPKDTREEKQRREFLNDVEIEVKKLLRPPHQSEQNLKEIVEEVVDRFYDEWEGKSENIDPIVMGRVMDDVLGTHDWGGNNADED